MTRLLALAAATAALAGCMSPDTTVRGKVIEGKVSMVGAVQASDARLKGPGIEGVLITGKMDPVRRGGGQAFSGLSGKDGLIEIKSNDLKVFSEEITVLATKDGYIPARQVIIVPAQGRKMLIVMQPTGVRPPP
jgi:hypothetical protein